MSSSTDATVPRVRRTQSAVRVGLLGCGVVGTGILRLLNDNARTIESRLGAPIEVVGIAVRDPSRLREGIVPAGIVTTDALALATRADVDVVVEVMGGLEPAGTYVRAAIAAGKHVVTANKALLAEEGDALLESAEARGVDLYFEAAVAGGIPIIRVLREGLASDRVIALRGIVNGTSNYVLSRMQHEGLDFDEVLRAAQELGYAEADPFLDVSGGDAAHKLSILATLAYGARVHPSQITKEGIDVVGAVDMRYARRFGFVIKPLAVARPVIFAGEEALDLRVHPALVKESSVLASIGGALNAVFVEGAMLGPCLMSGPGAGALPTAMSVVSDIVDVGRNLLADARGRVPARAFLTKNLREVRVQPVGAHRCAYYLRFSVRDRPGILARIAGVLGAFDVSIAQLVQDRRDHESPVAVVMLTHEALGENVARAITEIGLLHDVTEPPRAIRIEDTAVSAG